MAFRLRREESIDHGLRRLARKELGFAAEQVGSGIPGDEAIHAARKSVKKVRAIVELIRADGGRGLRGARKRLRAVNRSLSRLRDAEAIDEILKKLEQRNPKLFNEHTLARLQRELSAHKRDAMNTALENRVFDKTLRELRKLKRGARAWRPSHHGFPALEAGIMKSHRRGRRAMGRATRRQLGADFHEWRKQIKALWFKLRLIDCCSASLRKDLAALHRAEAYLGDEHNLAVLCGHLSNDPSMVQSAADLVRLRVAAGRYQRALRRKAIASARPIYSAKSRDYLRRVRRWWKSWKDQVIPARKQRSAVAA